MMVLSIELDIFDDDDIHCHNGIEHNGEYQPLFVQNVKLLHHPFQLDCLVVAYSIGCLFLLSELTIVKTNAFAISLFIPAETESIKRIFFPRLDISL